MNRIEALKEKINKSLLKFYENTQKGKKYIKEFDLKV
jgi:predicted  nucleic acid-binding Zn-ribbon protein